MTGGEGAPEPFAEQPRGRLAAVLREAARKVLHVTAASVAALVAWNLPRDSARTLFLGIALLAVAVDVGRLRSQTLRAWFARALAPVLRATEVRRVTGATTLALGFATVVALFTREAAVAGLLYAGYADAAGAIVGRAAGAHRFRSGKTLEGAAAFAIVAFFVGWIVAGLGAPAAAIVAVVLACLEAAPLPIDDNLLVPLAGSTLAYLASVVR